MLSGLLQVNNYSSWLQIKKSGGFSRRTTMVSFRRRTTVMLLAIDGERQWLASEGER